MTEREIHLLLKAGKYETALELNDGCKNRDVILQVMELSRRFPRLANDLRKAKNALTLARSRYAEIRKTADHWIKHVSIEVGPKFVTVELPGGTASLEGKLWDSLTCNVHWQEERSLSGPHVDADACRKWVEHVKEISQMLPGLSVKKTDWEAGFASSTFQRKACSLCGGTGRVTDGMFEKMVKDPKFRRMLEAQGIDNFEKPCPRCVRDAKLIIPHNSRKGWVVVSEDEEVLARIDELEGKGGWLGALVRGAGRWLGASKS